MRSARGDRQCQLCLSRGGGDEVSVLCWTGSPRRELTFLLRAFQLSERELVMRLLTELESLVAPLMMALSCNCHNR